MSCVRRRACMHADAHGAREKEKERERERQTESQISSMGHDRVVVRALFCLSNRSRPEQGNGATMECCTVRGGGLKETAASFFGFQGLGG